MKTGLPIQALGSLLAAAALLVGCEVRPKPIVHMAEYRSGTHCAPTAKECPWASLERQASFTALVNCLLDGATALEVEDSSGGKKPVELITAVEPKYGYEHVTISGDGKTCPLEETLCLVASRHDRELTRATCTTKPMKDITWRGGRDLAHADRLTETAVVIGRLPERSNEIGAPRGLDGPDHAYTFTITEKTRVEAAVAANTSYWSTIAGPIQSAWQPALYLLDANGEALQRGHVHRAGVSVLFPTMLEPGAYFLVVDTSSAERSRGDGIYHLYFGLNQGLMGPLVSPLSP